MSEISRPLQQQGVAEQALQKASGYKRACRGFMKVVEKDFGPGRCGEMTWTRDDLHER